MLEKLKFDFSKEEDQKRFEKLPEEEQTVILDDATKEAGNEKLARKHFDEFIREYSRSWSHTRLDEEKLSHLLQNATNQEQAIFAQKLLDADTFYLTAILARHFRLFTGLDPNQTALKIIAKGSDEVSHNLGNFHDLNSDVAVALLEKGEKKDKNGLRDDSTFTIGQNLSCFKDLDMRVADKFLASPYLQILCENISHFNPKYHNAIALKLLSRDKRNAVNIAKDLSSFQGLGGKVLEDLVEQGQAKTVSENISPQTFDLSDPLMSSVAETAIASILVNARGVQAGSSDGYVRRVKTLQEIFNLPKTTVTSLAQKAIQNLLTPGRSFDDDATEMQQIFKPPIAPDTKLAAAKVLVKQVLNRDVKRSDMIRKTFELSDEDVVMAAENAIADAIPRGKADWAEVIQTKLLPRERLSSFIYKYRQDIKAFFDDLKLASNDQLAKELCTYPVGSKQLRILQTVAQESPFLGHAIEENPRYGIKLALKLPELDPLSRENIRLLFEIQKENPALPADTFEFRKVVQERLKTYENNPAVLAWLQVKKVDVASWLNYDQESTFDLGKEEEVSLSEKLKTPVLRIRESLESYSGSLKNILAEYKKEFSGIMVSEDLEEVKLQIEKLTQEKERAFAEGNTKKADGIDKGLAQLTKRITNPKKIPLWEKALGDLSLVDRVTKDVLSAYTILIESETSLQNYSKDQSKSARERREEILKLKRKAESAKQEFVSKFKTLETRIISFKESLSKTLTSTIGEERTNKIIGDWETVIAEGMNHFESDKTTIASIFDHESGEQGNLDRTPMNIKLWSRNPDIDLYLGNYTDCCIRIDSEHMGEESTIADYLTDVGMQVVTVWDEKKKVPVIAAWTFVGVDENGETALVVDNIEANTDYSTNYRTQLEAKLKAYFTEYTKAVGLKKFVQGQSNNDLVIAEMDGKYKKLGGYNREDGYFLEGEHDDEDDEVEGENEDNNN